MQSLLCAALLLVVAPTPAEGGLPDPASCVAVAGVAVDDEWCRTSCGATTPNCPAAVCACGNQAKEAAPELPVLPAPVPAPEAVPEEAAKAAVPEDAAPQAEPAARSFTP